MFWKNSETIMKFKRLTGIEIALDPKQIIR